MKNKHKGSLIVWVVVSLLILGGVFYFFSKNKASVSKEESRLLVTDAITQNKMNSHPMECLSWKEIENSDNWIIWEFTKEWKDWNISCPALSPDADIPYPIMRAKVNLITKEVLFEALDGEYR